MDEEENTIKGIIVKFLAGEISNEEMNFLKSSLENDPEVRRIFNTTNELWQEASTRNRFEYFKTDEAWDKISSKLRSGKDEFRPVFIMGRYKYFMLMAAASIACLIVIGGFTLWLKESQPLKQRDVAWTIVSTDEGEKAHVYLSDSTNVCINSGSSLKYNADYNKKERMVRLSGEAFFDVRSNPEKPFVVQIEKMTVSATGTKFNVLSYEDEDRIETTLEKGKIQVAIKGMEPIDIKSGQQVVYFTRTNQAFIRDVATETYTSWKENKLRLIDTPFEEALRKIARRYNVTFEIRNSDLLDLKYTATFIDESIEEVMMMLQKVSPVSYQIYYLTSINDKKYLQPRIVLRKRKS